MYGFLSIIVICMTVLWMFQHMPTSFRIIHENHQHEHLDPERFKDRTPPQVDTGEETYETPQETLDKALAKIQHSINIVNGVEEDTNGK